MLLHNDGCTGGQKKLLICAHDFAVPKNGGVSRKWVAYCNKVSVEWNFIKQR